MPNEIYDSKAILLKQTELINYVTYHRTYAMADPFHVQDMVLNGKTGSLVDFMVVILAYPLIRKEQEYPKWIAAYKRYYDEGYRIDAERSKQNSVFTATVMTKLLPAQNKPLRVEALLVKEEAPKPAPAPAAPEPAATAAPAAEPAPQPKEEKLPDPPAELPAAIRDFLNDPNRKENTLEVTLTADESSRLADYKESILSQYGLTARFNYLSKKDDMTVYRMKVINKK